MSFKSTDDNSVSGMCKFKGRHSDTEYHNPFADISDKRSLIFYTQVAILEWEKWVKVGICKLRGREYFE
jgi:hypothetical protein